MPEFCHLHCHTQYSLLDGFASIPDMIAKAKNDGQKAVALTDHGNMYGAFRFVAEATKAGVIPIVGCEFYVVEDRFRKQFTKMDRDKRYHQLILAKDQEGYKNLSKLCSLGFIDGMYSKYPRVDKALIKQYKEGLIATSCCLGAEVPQAIANLGEEKAEKILLEWLDIFGDDYYIELQRHNIPNVDGSGLSQEDINQVLIRFSKKYGIKMIATNDSHYTEQEDANPHDILLCVNTGDLKENLNRFKFENDEFYFKTQAEMSRLFADVPEAVENTLEIVDKITPPQLKRDILLPNFTLPPDFKTEDDYLRHLTYKGAEKRYNELNSEVIERIELELRIIADMGFAGYFLIVQDFIAAARKMKVSVGPGRGSAAGSVVAYATGITNIDPIKYQLLFERFLNPERVTMPDIDIDFDDDGRQRVIDYVIDKYGKNQVAQIITFGTMAAKSSIRDVARTLNLPLSDADRLAKLVPESPGITLSKAFKEVKELNEIKKEDSLSGETLRLAEKLEGSVRQTGVHAAGVIIAPDNIMEYIPVCTAKDADLWLTQFDGKLIEDAGMLKMDFLGLKTLSIIKDAIAIIKRRHDIVIDPDEIPLDDEKTIRLFQKGQTIGIFQFESAGMQKYLKDLKPTDIEDLIAMNALYRPGPMDYIPDFVDRKHGRKKVEYPHPKLEGILKPTYGIMVYQEQIMQTAQILADYSLGEADILRRIMGKKKPDLMQSEEKKFLERATAKGLTEDNAKDVFEIMAKFAGYGFNRSHAAAYSVVAFQTAYLKAHYPAEFLAAVLSHNMSAISNINFFLREAKRMGVEALGPDVNESHSKFTVNKKGQIRFALSAIKGVGASAVESMLEERDTKGPFENIFDLVRRANLRSVNKKCLESLALAGAFDNFGNMNRAQYFYQTGPDEPKFIEHIVRYGNSYQQSLASNQNSLFGDLGDMEVADPNVPECQEWHLLERLQKEKELTGIYLSGHPLDDYRIELQSFTTCKIGDVTNYKNVDLKIGGILSKSNFRTSNSGNQFANFSIEDFDGGMDLFLFGSDFMKYKNYIMEPGTPLFISGRYQPRRFREDEFEFKINKIELLPEVRENRKLNLRLRIDLSDLDNELITKLDTICSGHPGKSEMFLGIYDASEQYKVDMRCKKYKVKICDKLLGELEDMEGISYQFLTD